MSAEYKITKKGLAALARMREALQDGLAVLEREGYRLNDKEHQVAWNLLCMRAALTRTAMTKKELAAMRAAEVMHERKSGLPLSVFEQCQNPPHKRS